ncbi:MAG TPA: NADP-dependent oxidoreductase [Micromonospora sp.]|nr:NADP-dependent oxidoreductase [Micromonospora sp.]
MAKAHAVHLVRRPNGAATTDQFEIAELDLAPVEDGQALVRNLLLSVDPYMRQLMSEAWPLNAPLGMGRAIGVVEQSRSPRLPEGALVVHNGGLQTHIVFDADDVGVRPLVTHEGVALESYLSMLGGTGLTAYAGLTKVFGVTKGDVVFLTSIAGGVGVAAAQIARQLGSAKVLGTTSADAKCRFAVNVLGADRAANWKTAAVSDFLAEYAGEGLSATLDGVGGGQLEAAIDASARHARIALVGGISHYDTGKPWVPPKNFEDIHFKALTVRGYAVRDYLDLREEAEDFLVPLMRSGAIVDPVTVTEGFAEAPAALVGVLQGANTGKAIVRSAISSEASLRACCRCRSLGATSCARSCRSPLLEVSAAAAVRPSILWWTAPRRRPRCCPARQYRLTSATASSTPASCYSSMLRAICPIWRSAPSVTNLFGGSHPPSRSTPVRRGKEYDAAETGKS